MSALFFSKAWSWKLFPLIDCLKPTVILIFDLSPLNPLNLVIICSFPLPLFEDSLLKCSYLSLSCLLNDLPHDLVVLISLFHHNLPWLGPNLKVISKSTCLYHFSNWSCSESGRCLSVKSLSRKLAA